MSRLIAIIALLASAAPSFGADPAVSFRTDVIAALSRVGCNSGACHGSPQGKNGFRMSLRGQDPDLDFATLTKELGGRRVNRQSPDDSLVLLKATGRVSHGGGQLFGRDHAAYRAVAKWIAEGAADDKPSPLVKVVVTPDAKRLDPANPSQQLTATAHFADGTSRDVTALTVFTTSEGTAKVTPEGLVTFARTGEASVLARYLTGITSVRLQLRETGRDVRVPRARGEQLHRHRGVRQAEGDATPPRRGVLGRRVLAPRLPRHHRHAAHPGGGRGVPRLEGEGQACEAHRLAVGTRRVRGTSGR